MVFNQITGQEAASSALAGARRARLRETADSAPHMKKAAVACTTAAFQHRAEQRITLLRLLQQRLYVLAAFP